MSIAHSEGQEDSGADLLSSIAAFRRFRFAKSHDSMHVPACAHNGLTLKDSTVILERRCTPSPILDGTSIYIFRFRNSAHRVLESCMTEELGVHQCWSRTKDLASPTLPCPLMAPKETEEHRFMAVCSTPQPLTTKRITNITILLLLSEIIGVHSHLLKLGCRPNRSICNVLQSLQRF